MKRFRAGRLAGAAACVVAIALTAACSSSTSDDATSSSASAASAAPSESSATPESSGAVSAEVAAAQAVIDPYLQPMTSITVTEPLAAAPTPGRTMVDLSCEAPLCAVISAGVEAATEAAGWEYKKINYSSADPATITAGLREALQYDPVAVTIPGIPPDTGWNAVFPEYEEAGVPIIVSFMNEIPLDGPIQGNVADGTVWRTNSADIIANWIIADSGGKAHVLNQRVDPFSGVKAFSDQVAKVLEEKCPDCVVTDLSNTIEQAIGNGIIPTIVPELQKDPSIEYVVAGSLEYAEGLPTAMDAANVTAKIVGQTPSKTGYQQVKDGEFAAATVFPGFYSGWLIVDTAARLDADQPLDPGDTASLPNQLLLPTSTFEVADSQDPAGYQDQFKALWQVS